MFNAVFQRNGNTRGANAPVNPGELAALRWLAEDDADQQAHYVALRKWYDGDHEVPLTPRQREYLAIDSQFEFAVNYLRLPVDLCVERLSVAGFDGPEGIGGEDGLLAEWWQANRMDGTQNQVHRATIKDGDAYILVEWDNERGIPVFSLETAYDGTEGAKVHYLDNTRRRMTFASKRWTERRLNGRGEFETTRRLNLYHPDRIEKYIDLGKGWQPWLDDGAQWPLPWPAGVIPMVHFRWKDDGRNWGESELEPLVELQMALNKAVIDILETADKTAAQTLIVTGAKVPDGLTYKAGDILSIGGAAGGSVGITIVPGGDLSQLRSVVNDHIIRMAQISHIPLQYFQLTGAVASAETQAADDTQLTAKVKSESVSLGNAWEDVMNIALRLNREYGDGRGLPEGERIETRWADFERVDALALEERRAAVVNSLVNAGLSLEGILALPSLKYSEEQQAVMLRGDAEGVEQ